MKRVTKLFLFVLFLFIISINTVFALEAEDGEGGYRVSSGSCKKYVNITVNPNNPSGAGSTSAYCIEEGQNYTRPEAADYHYCGNGSNDITYNFSCVDLAVAYIGSSNLNTSSGRADFWAAQKYLNGKDLFVDKNCTQRVSTDSIIARAQEYCTAPTLSNITMSEGETRTITLSSVSEYSVSSYSGLTVSKSGSSITITAGSAGTGTISFSKGVNEPVKLFCHDNYDSQGRQYTDKGQDLLAVLGAPKVQTQLRVNIEPGVGHLTIIKVDSNDSSVKLSGAEFKICTNSAMTEGCFTRTTGTNGTNGTIVTDDYQLPQTLYVQELSAPNKYDIINTGVTTVPLEGSNTNLTVQNTKKRGYLSITKEDSNHPTTKLAGAVIKVCTNSAMTSNCEPLTTGSDGTVRTTNTYPLDTTLYYEEITPPAGYRSTSGVLNKTITIEGANAVTVTNTKVQTLKIKKTDSEMPSELLSGAKFKVCTNQAMNSGCLADLLETGANGETQEIGPYDEGTVLWIKEEVPPEYYDIDELDAQRIVIGRENYIHSVTDTIKKATFKLVKKDSVDSQILLEGAEYKVCMNESMTSNCRNYVTGSQGTFTTSEYRINTNVYYQEITAPVNYQLDSNVYRFKLSSEGVNSKVVTDVLKRGYLKIVKVTTDETPISGTTFQIGTNLDGVQGTDWDYHTTDENGVIIFQDVPVGTTYYYKEIDTPRGFINDNVTGTKMIANTLDSNDIMENLITITNEYVRGTIKIFKYGKNYKPLKGVQFKIGTDLDGEQGVGFDYYYTDESGEILAEDLFLNIEGDTIYKIQEIEALPGYSIDPEIHELALNVEYTTNSNFSSIQIINNTVVPLKEVKIYKLARSTNEPIPDVKINVYKKDGTLYREAITDAKGETQVELESGDYYFEEVETPTGYKPINGKVKFSFIGSGAKMTYLSLTGDTEEFYEVVIYNDIINVKTGSFNILIPFIVLFVSAPILFVYLRKHQKLI